MDLSFWEAQTYFKDIDVAVIGGGIVGLNAALHLKSKNSKLKIVVFERGILPTGGSSKNAGFACFGSPSELLDDLKKNSEEQVFSLVEKRWKGLTRLRKNIGDKAIDFKQWGGFEIFDNEVSFHECSEKLNYLNKNIEKITGEKNTYEIADQKIKGFGFGHIRHIIKNKLEGQIDTGKMLYHLNLKAQKLGIIVLNAIPINTLTDLHSHVALVTESGYHFDVRRVLIATNGFAKQLLPEYPVIPARAQVLITYPIKGLKVKGTFHYEKGYYYFRNIGERLLLGGGRNLDFKREETTELGLTDTIQKKLEHLLKTVVLPGVDYSIEQRWSGIMGLGPQKSSIVKAVSKNVFCAVRMGGMGVAIGSLVGEEGADLVYETL